MEVGLSTFGHCAGVYLTAKNRRRLWLPRGFAHRLYVLFETSDVTTTLRTAWVYAGRGRNIWLTVQRIAHNGTPLRVVDDQFGCAGPARFLAAGTTAILERCNYSRDELHPRRYLPC